MNRRSLILLLAFSIGGISLLVFLQRFIAVVPAGQVGVVDLFGQVSEQTLSPGAHFKSPLANVVLFSTQTKEVKESAEAPSKDGLTVTVDVSIFYRLDPTKIKQIYQTIGTDYEQVVIIPQSRAFIRNATASYESKTLYTTKRQELSQQLRRELGQVLADRGVIVEDAHLRNVVLPEKIQQAVQAKLQAEQETQRMEFILQKEQQEAERKRIEARGIADSQRIISQGLNENILRFRQIEAMEKLASTQNSKVVVIGGEQKAPTMLLQP
jgi:regulator of protease activity HflC (stomatin/prohibitin superfamily)